MNIRRLLKRNYQSNKGQVLLPSVLLLPIFILLVYLLFDLTNLSINKVQHQFALDNAAYTQLTTLSSYLNAMAMINGPSLYRVMITYQGEDVKPVDEKGKKPENIFNLFYKGGSILAIGPDHEKGINPKPRADSVDWDVQYYDGKDDEEDKQELGHGIPAKKDGHKDWMVPHPKWDKKPVIMMNKDLISNAALTMDATVTKIAEYLKWVFYLGNIYDNQTYTAQQLTNNAAMFREGYFVNVTTCRPSECAKQSAQVLAPYLKIQAKPFDIDVMRAYFNDWTPGSGVNSPIAFDLTSQDLNAGRDMFMFSYLTPESVTLLRKLERGVVLKQPYRLPANSLKLNLEAKYKPYTRVTVSLQCPRRGNNCVWPNPLPKYNVLLMP